MANKTNYSAQKRREQYYKNYNKKVIRLFIIIFVISMFLTFAITRTLTRDPKYIQTGKEIVTIKSGDTLWNICSEYVPEGIDIRQFINIVEAYNHMETCEIYAGDTLYIPLFEEVWY